MWGFLIAGMLRRTVLEGVHPAKVIREVGRVSETKWHGSGKGFQAVVGCPLLELLPSMNLLMPDQVRAPSEGLATQITHIGLLSGVGFIMLYES